MSEYTMDVAALEELPQLLGDGDGCGLITCAVTCVTTVISDL